MNLNIRGATGREGRTDLKLENKSQCIKYKRDGGTTIEPDTRWATRDFGAGCKREYVRVLRLIGKVNEPEFKGGYGGGGKNRLEIGGESSMYKIQKRWWDDGRARDTVGDEGFWGRLQKRICKSLEANW